MYFLYILILCYTSILLTPVNTYVVLAANLNDFQRLVKKYVPKNLVGQIKAMVLENGHKYYKEPSEDDEQVDGNVEYTEDSLEYDSYEVTKEFKTRQQPVYRYQSKSTQKVALSEPSVPSLITPLTLQTVLTIDDIVEKVKQGLFQQILDNSVNGKNLNAQPNSQAESAQTGGSLAYRNFPKKSFKVTEAKGQVHNPVNKLVPMKVIKEEVQFEATYEDTLDKDMKPQNQYVGQAVHNPAQYLHSKPITDRNTKSVSPKNNSFVNTQYERNLKKVRFLKQVLVPVNLNQGYSAYAPQPSLVQKPTIVQYSNLKPHLSLIQKSSKMQKAMYTQVQQQANIQKSTIMKLLVLMQQQIEQLNRTVQQTELNKKRTIRPTSMTLSKAPQLNIEVVETNFKIVPNPTANVQKTYDGNEVKVEPSKEKVEESILSEEITITSADTESSTKALTLPGTADNEQFTEENEAVQDSFGTVENDDEATKETTPEETHEEVDTKLDSETVEGKDKNTKLDANAKVHTQEFGNPDAGEPIVAKTYNFNEAKVEAGKESVNLKLLVDSARKVMLF